MEGRRIFTSKLFLSVLIGLLLVNCFFFAYRSDRSYADAYHAQLAALSGKSHQECLQWAKDYQDKAWIQIGAGRWDYEGKEEQLRQIAIALQGQYEYLLEYPGYLEKIQVNAKKLQGVSLFSTPDSRAYKNTIKTAEDFAAMKGVEVTAGHDLAVTQVFGDTWQDYSILILICVVCGMLVAERREGLWSMLYAAPGGRGRLALRRIAILFGVAWLGSFLLVGSKILLCGWCYHGLGEWGRTLQSIPMFQNVPTPMTIGQFWLLYLTVKAFGAFWIGLTLWAVLSAISNIGLAMGAAGLLVGTEYAFTAIPSASIFAILRYVNLFSYVDFGEVFTRYLNLPVFGFLISGSDLVLAILPMLCILFSALNVVIAEKKYPISPMNPILGWWDTLRKKVDPQVPQKGEAHKLLIKCKGIWLLLLLAVVVYHMDTPPRKAPPNDAYILHWQQQFAGKIGENTESALEAAMEEALDFGNTAGIRHVLQQIENAPKGAWIVPEAPYEAIWSNNLGNYHRSTALIALLFSVLLLAPIVSQERQHDMTPLLRSTPAGRRKLFWKKQILLLSMVFPVWVIIYGSELFRTMQEYGAFYCLKAPAYSLSMFPETLSLPLGWLLTAYYGGKLAVLTIVGEFCFFLSSRSTKNRDAILLCGGFILIPAALATIGSTIGEFFSFLLPLSGTELLWLFFA